MAEPPDGYSQNVDVTQATFQADVVEKSRTVPVVVDFWAAWCGPCRMLTPVLEREIARREGRIELAKVDVDANPGLAQEFGVQGIPAVKAFRDGRVAAEFVGAQPATAVSRFLDSLVPSEADELVAQGDEASLRRALELDSGRADAALPLARRLLARGEREQALAIVSGVHGSFAADGLAARIRLEAAGVEDLAPAFAALDRGDTALGLDLLISAIRPSRRERDDIRKTVVGILDQLGRDDPLTEAARAKLTSVLY